MNTKTIIDKTGENYVFHKYNLQGAEIATMLICAQTAHNVATELKKILPEEVIKALIDK